MAFLILIVCGGWARSAGKLQFPSSSSSQSPSQARQYFEESQQLLRQGNLDAALEAAQGGLKQAPRSVPGLTLLGTIYARKGDFAQAEKTLQSAIQIDPQSVSARNSLGGIYFSDKKFDLAEKEFREILRTHPGDRDANYNLGLVLLARRDASQAMVYLQRVQPPSPDVLLNLAQAYFAAGQKSKAMDLVKSLSHEAGNDVRLHFTLGVLLAGEKQYSDAIHEFETADAHAPGTFEILFDLGKAYLRNGDDEKAKEVLNRALALNSDSADTLYYLAQANSDESKDLDALDLLVKAHKLAPRNTDVVLLMARLSMKQEYYEDAIPLLEEGLRIDPHRPDLLAALGECYFVAGKVDQALATFQTLLHVDSSSRSYAFLGVCYRHLGRFSEAEKYLQQGLRLDPRSVPCLYNLGFIASREGQYELGDRYLAQALQIDPNYVEALLELADSKMHQRKFAEAVPLLRRCTQLNPQASPVYYRLAEAERNLHQSAAAENDLKIFQTLSKNPPAEPYPFQHLYDYLGQRAELSPRQKSLYDLAQLEQEVKRHPDHPQNYYMLAEAYLKAGRIDDARQAITHLDQLSQGDFRTTVGVGVLLARYHLYDEAIARFEQALQINPDSDDVWYDLADACFHKRDYASALIAAQRVSPDGEKDASYSALLADILAHLGRGEEAEKLFRQVIAENPDETQVYLSLALVYLRGGNASAARKVLEAALARVPDSGELLWGMGVLSVMEGQTEKAQSYLEKAVNLLPEWPGSYSALGLLYYQTGQAEKSRQVLDRFAQSGRRGLDVQRIRQALDAAERENPGSEQVQPLTPQAQQQFLQMASAFADQAP